MTQTGRTRDPGVRISPPGASLEDPMTKIAPTADAVETAVATERPQVDDAAMTIAASDADASLTRLIPLRKLKLHEDNVRRTDRTGEIEALAASIHAHGLLQNLAVVALGDDRYGVVAGGRRLAALKRLARDGRIAKDFEAPCLVLTAEQAREASLAENTQRTAMNVMDEVEAFAALVDAGAGVDDIARRFGATVRHVEQRLALARLSPKIRTGYRKGDLTLDVARAFCLASDHATQERVYAHFAKPLTQAHVVRHALSQGRIAASDRMALFVGVERYEAAGGRLVRDLFEDGVAFLEDGALVQRLAHEKLQAAIDGYLAEGWGWAEVRSGHHQAEGCVSERLQPTRRRPKPAEKRAIEAARADLARLETAVATAADDSPLWIERDAAEASLDALENALCVFDPTLIAHAGVVVSVDHDGRLHASRGLIKRTDFKALEKARTHAVGSGGNADDDAPRARDEDAPAARTRLPKTLACALTTARTIAIRTEIAQRPDVALALLVDVLAAQAARASLPGIAITARMTALTDAHYATPAESEDDTDDGDAAGGSLARRLATPVDALLLELAGLLAATLDFSHEDAAPADRRVQALGDEISAALDLDMRRFWNSDLDFWTRAPKAFTLAALETAPAIAALPDAERRALLARHATLKRADLAGVALETLGDAGWLPDLLVTPLAAGALALTEAAHAALDGAI